MIYNQVQSIKSPHLTDIWKEKTIWKFSGGEKHVFGVYSNIASGKQGHWVSCFLGVEYGISFFGRGILLFLGILDRCGFSGAQHTHRMNSKF